MAPNFFKIRLSQLLIILLVSLPVGVYIYVRNIDKISYLGFIVGAKLMTENYCNEINRAPNPLLISTDELRLILLNLSAVYSSLKPSYKSDPALGYLTDRGVYQLTIGGREVDIKIMDQIGALASERIHAAELASFRNKFESVRLHCNSVAYPLYKYVHAGARDHYFEVRYSYKKLHVLISSVTPLIFLYFVMVLYNYIRVNASSLRRAA